MVKTIVLLPLEFKVALEVRELVEDSLEMLEQILPILLKLAQVAVSLETLRISQLAEDCLAILVVV